MQLSRGRGAGLGEALPVADDRVGCVVRGGQPGSHEDSALSEEREHLELLGWVGEVVAGELGLGFGGWR